MEQEDRIFWEEDSEDKEYEEMEKDSYDHGYGCGYDDGFMAGQKSLINLLKQVGINVDLDTLMKYRTIK